MRSFNKIYDKEGRNIQFETWLTASQLLTDSYLYKGVELEERDLINRVKDGMWQPIYLPSQKVEKKP